MADMRSVGVEAVVAVRVDPEDTQVVVPTADIRAGGPGDHAAQPREPGQEPRPEFRPTRAPATRQEVVDRPSLSGSDVIRDAMGREREDGSIHEVGMATGQELRVSATGRDAHDRDRPAPLLADDGGVVVRDIGGRATGRKVRSPPHLHDG